MANRQMSEWPQSVANEPRRVKDQSPLPPRPLAPLLLPPTLYLLISLTATWPLVTHLRGWVPGWGDWGQNMWALWWTRKSLLVLGQTPFFTNYLFHPEGVSLLFHPLDVSDGLLAIPLYGLLGGDTAYNVMVLLSFVLGGWGTYLLALYLTGRRGASFVAGLVFALSPYHFLRIDLGHLNLSTVQWLPFYALFLLKFAQTGSRRAAGLAIFFLLFTALNSWYYVVYCGLFSLAIIFWPSKDKRQKTNDEGQVNSSIIQRSSSTVRRQWSIRFIRVAIVLAAAVLILSPLLLPMFRLLGSTTLVGAHNPLRHSADLLSFFVPGLPSTWAGWFEDVWISYAAQNREPGASAYVGYTVLALSLAALFSRRFRWRALWWAAVALGFTLLALGPQLQIDGQILDIWLPYHWLSRLFPIFAITGIPGRFVVMTSLALAVLAAYGLAAISGRLAQNLSAVNLGLCAAAALLVTLEYLAIPLRLTPTRLPEFYRTLAANTESFAVLDIKWDANYLMHAQTVHHKPLVGGWLARLPQQQAEYLEQDSLDKAFLYLLLGPEALSADPATLQPAIRAALAGRNARYIINHSPAARPWLEQIVGWPIVYEEEGIVVYGEN